MTTSYTQHEWVTIFDEAEQALPGILPEYRAPTVGSAAFARTIDHTILKLGATQKDIDRLCAEAKKHMFKVRKFYGSSQNLRDVIRQCRVLPGGIVSS